MLQRIYNFLEKKRIQNHLRYTEISLRNVNTSNLSDNLKIRRQKHLDVLHNYWVKGIFPKNTDFSDRREPYFVDKFGTYCAMAFLIAESGKKNIVKKVVKENNNIRIDDINGGPVLDFITKSGLSKKEAALIQPSYGPCGMAGCPPSVGETWLPWILGTLSFLILEWLSFKMRGQSIQLTTSQRVAGASYFTIINLTVALVLVYVFNFLVSGYSRIHGIF